MLKVDKNIVIVAVSVIALFVGMIIYLSIPRDLERETSSMYLNGRKDIVLFVAILMMFGGATGTVFGVAQMKPDVGTSAKQLMNASKPALV
jgi:hypothetical protein